MPTLQAREFCCLKASNSCAGETDLDSWETHGGMRVGKCSKVLEICRLVKNVCRNRMSDTGLVHVLVD